MSATQDLQTDADSPLNVAVVIGSVRTPRLGGPVARWFLEQAGQRDLKIDVIDLREITLSPGLEPTDEVRALGARVGAADAFVMITPEYNHGYSAALKLAIDSLRKEWFAKPVGFVSYGGLAGGLRAVEQLRQVCSELHMVTLRDTVSLHDARAQFDQDGRLRQSDAANAAVATLLDRLVWWAEALRAARTARPYVK
jgi:NAD(P)H-dependent FMN reductase